MHGYSLVTVPGLIFLADLVKHRKKKNLYGGYRGY